MDHDHLRQTYLNDRLLARTSLQASFTEAKA